MIRIEFYTRDGCHLCDAAWYVVQRAVAGADATVEKIDIDDDPVLRARYGDDIPVVLIDGVERFRHRVVESELRRLVASPNPRSGG